MASIRHGGRKPYARPTRGGANGQWQHDKFPGVAHRRPAVLANEILEEGPNGSKLEVSNLHYEIMPKDLTYDSSGRSSGKAFVVFETSAEALRAKNQFDGILAKGQPLSIRFAPKPPTGPRRAVSAPLSLLSRIEKPPLLERVSRDDADAVAATTSTRKANGSGGGGRGRIGPVRTRGQHQPRGPRKGRENKQPKTAEDLDKELDAFMVDAGTTADNTSGETATPAPDVDMA